MRRPRDFHGGIHPPERKELSNAAPIRRAKLPQQLVLPLQQHLGPGAKPVVTVGQRVLGGERLTDLSGLPIHAPSSGTVLAIEDRPVPHVSGMHAPCVVIETDGLDEWSGLEPLADFKAQTPAALTERIFEAGIAGLGGAGFPTARKMPSVPGSSVATLIINGTECEPYITADDLLMRERAEDIIAGIDVLAHISGPREILIGVEDNKPESIAALRLALGARTDIEIVVFPTKYPSGGEKQLIEILTGKQVPSGGLPLDIGVLCQNVGTAVAVCDAVLRGRPLVSRITTVTGESARDRGNFEVLLGTSMLELLEQAGYAPTNPQRLVMGGPMMGISLPDHHCPVVKTTNCLLVPGPGELADPAPAQACIRCGLCAEACPAQLLPQQLYWYARSRNHDGLEEHNLFDCIECGACSYVCPSNIPLVQYYRSSKASIREQRLDSARSEHARQRFEARQERMATASAEKEARRAARKRAALARAAEQTGAEDPIQAAIARAQARKAALSTTPETAARSAADQLAKTQARLGKAREKLAQDDGSDPAISTALANAVRITEEKLAALRSESTREGTAPDSRQADQEHVDT